MSKAIIQVPMSQIAPDADQPRRNFDPTRLGDLKRSIEKHGIINPIVLEKSGSGYIVVDGERRYRAAKELKLKDVPALIVNAQEPTERLIQQFHIQEQHEGWTAIEKASAVAKLSHSLKVSMTEIGKILSIPVRTINTYMAFAQLFERREFEKSEISINFAERIVGLRRYTKSLVEKAGEQFSKDDEISLERTIISRIKSGEIRKATDLNKIRDAVKADPKSIKKFLKNERMSIQKLFIDADAAVAYYYRNIAYSAKAIALYTEKGMELGVQELLEKDSTALHHLKAAQKAIDLLIGKSK